MFSRKAFLATPDDGILDGDSPSQILLQMWTYTQEEVNTSEEQIKSSQRTQLKHPKSSEANVKSSKSSQRSRHARTSRAALLQFQMVSDLFQTSLYTGGFKPVSDLFGIWDVHKFPYNCRISGYSCFRTVLHSFRPVSDLFGMSINFHINVGSADTVAFPTASHGFRPVLNLVGVSSHLCINVGSADIAAFLQLQTVSELFQTSLDWPVMSIYM